MRTEYIVWDRLHSGFVYPEPGMVTHNPLLAQTFTGTTEQILAAFQQDEPDPLRYAVLYKPDDNEKHPAYTTLTVGHAELVQVKESGRDQTVLLVRNGPQYSVLAELELIESEQSAGFRYYWTYHNPKIGTLCMHVADSLQQAWRAAKDYARHQQCKRSASQQSKMLAFIRALNHSTLTFSERVALFPQSMPFAQSVHENPFYQPRKPTFQIGDQYVIQDERERLARIRTAVRTMLKACRTPFSRRIGKLDKFSKEDIRLAVAIMQNADRIDVVGMMHQLPGRAFTGASSMMQSSYLQYQLAYHATLNGMRQVVIPPIE